MNKQLILGIDGGGTKSHLAIFNAAGKCMGTYSYGPLNHEAMSGSFAEFEERLGEFLPSSLRKLGATITDVNYAVFGLAGVDTDSQEKRISDIVRRIGIKHYVVCNDALLGVAAGCPDCIGICAINGTGFKLAAIDRNGTALQICGVGGYTDDRGGGGWYGIKAIGAVYNELYKLGQPTIMKDILFEMTGVSRREDYLEAVTEKFPGSQPNAIEFNSVMFNAAALGDTVALNLLGESADQYAGAIARLIMDLDFPVDEPVYVTLAGSAFVKQKIRILQELIAERVDNALDGKHTIEYSYLDTPPVAGAVMWAAQKAGFNIEMQAIKEGISKL